MSELADFLGRLVGALDHAEIHYMLAGSIASSYHGAPRMTQDVDVVVDLYARHLGALAREFPDDKYYFPLDAAREAVRRSGQFNVVDFATGWKADLIVRKPRAFNDEEFLRRVRGSVFGIDVWLASPEDTILSKLEWAKASGGSERQLRDVRGIITAQTGLDQAYLVKWAAALEVSDLLDEAQHKSQ